MTHLDYKMLQQDLVDETAFDHGAISRFNAWFFNAFERYINSISRTHKARAFDGLSGDSILEIGAGTGANMRFLPGDAHLYAVEPSLRMHRKLREKADRAGIQLTVLGTRAEEIPLPDNSVDEALASLVLCTVEDPERVLSEVRRVLKPGGAFRFVEHVAAAPGTLRRRLQDRIKRPWGWLFEGCDPARATPDLLERAGFDTLTLERRNLHRSVFYPVNTAVWGEAR